jgi:cysteine-rich repeat protein
MRQGMVVGALILIAATVACVTPGTAPCEDGSLCGTGLACAPRGGCADEDQLAACEGKADGDACTLAGLGAGVCRDDLCGVSACGDGALDDGEACDDGNQIDDDGCSNACRLPRCGDQIVQLGEACDDGAANGDDRACLASCQVAACGDGKLLAGVEACDLGAGNSDGGACTLGCQAASCGDGLTWLGVEGCDDGNDVDDDACSNGCALPTCGDGLRQAGEGCDDGVANGDDRACLLTCQVAACGDGRVWAGHEACDAGAGNDDAGACTLACAAAACGDGRVWDGVEVCDDGNEVDGDGCRADCAKIEACGDAERDAGEACDDGNGNPVDGCDDCVATTWSAAPLIDGQSVALELGLTQPFGVAMDRSGNIFVADSGANRVRRISPVDGSSLVVAGTGVAGFAGDGGPATAALLNFPIGLAVDGLGNLFVADSLNHRIRRVDAATGLITTVAGSALAGFSGDGGPATSARLNEPYAVAVSGGGDVYFTDRANNRVRRIVAATGFISTMAGNGVVGDSGDGGPATAAAIHAPEGVAVAANGDLYISNTYYHRVRRVAASTGIITTIAGTGVSGFAGDGGMATAAQLADPRGLALTGEGDLLLITDGGNNRIRRVDLTAGTIATIAGTGLVGMGGDGGPATAAMLFWPQAVAVDQAGNVAIADRNNNRIRRIRALDGILHTVAGTGAQGELGDGQVATSVDLSQPGDVAVSADGTIYVAHWREKRVRKVDPSTGVITTIAGTGTFGFSGDGGPAVAAKLAQVNGIALAAAGHLYVADTGNQRVRRIDKDTGVITTVAGKCCGSAGDGGPATAASLSWPTEVVLDADGNLFIADVTEHRVRRVDAVTGVITTYVGTGVAGDSGDGGLATAATVDYPGGLAVDASGNLYVSDRLRHRVRRIDKVTGIITAFAGTGTAGNTGDDGPATSATLRYPAGLAMQASGDLIIADYGNYRVRRVATATNEISAVTGPTGQPLGDGGPAIASSFSLPELVAVAPGSDDLYVLDVSRGFVRRIDHATGLIETIAGGIDVHGQGPMELAMLSDPHAVVLAGADVWFAAGATGHVQRLAGSDGILRTVAGRYPADHRGRGQRVLSPELVRRGRRRGDRRGARRRLRERDHRQPDPRGDAGRSRRPAHLDHRDAGRRGRGRVPGRAARQRAPARAGRAAVRAGRAGALRRRSRQPRRPRDRSSTPAPSPRSPARRATLGYFGDGRARRRRAPARADRRSRGVPQRRPVRR